MPSSLKEILDSKEFKSALQGNHEILQNFPEDNLKGFTIKRSLRYVNLPDNKGNLIPMSRQGVPLVYEFVEIQESKEGIINRFRANLRKVGLERHASETVDSLSPFKFLKGKPIKILVPELLKGRSLFLEGKPGTGKTSLACALALEIMLKHKPVTIYRWSWFMSSLKNSFGDFRKSELDRIASHCKLLILDELGRDNKNKISDFENETLFEIITARYGNNLPSIITSNLGVGLLEDLYGKAVMDRILDKKNIHFNFDSENSWRRDSAFDGERIKANVF